MGMTIWAEMITEVTMTCTTKFSAETRFKIQIIYWNPLSHKSFGIDEDGESDLIVNLHHCHHVMLMLD